MSDDPPIALILVLLASFAVWFFFIRESEQQKQARLERERKLEEERRERERQKERAKVEFDTHVSRGIPPRVASTHRSFLNENPLPAGRAWYGEEVSPLTFYGYRVGKARGLNQAARRDIIEYVLRARLIDPLARSYQSNWGTPLSPRRRVAIISHLNKLAAQRASRRGYEVAVAEWEADSRWAATLLRDEINRIGGYGFG